MVHLKQLLNFGTLEKIACASYFTKGITVDKEKFKKLDRRKYKVCKKCDTLSKKKWLSSLIKKLK